MVTRYRYGGSKKNCYGFSLPLGNGLGKTVTSYFDKTKLLLVTFNVTVTEAEKM
jgi:hypothetical protein